MFYVELTRARDNVVLLTDDREALIEALETAPAEELSALKAIGEQFALPPEMAPPMPPVKAKYFMGCCSLTAQHLIPVGRTRAVSISCNGCPFVLHA